MFSVLCSIQNDLGTVQTVVHLLPKTLRDNSEHAALFFVDNNFQKHTSD
jgi:hypothetical protein